MSSTSSLETFLPATLLGHHERDEVRERETSELVCCNVVRVGGACGPPPPVAAPALRAYALLPAATPRLIACYRLTPLLCALEDLLPAYSHASCPRRSRLNWRYVGLCSAWAKACPPWSFKTSDHRRHKAAQ